jgi:hypothetical protein
MISDQNNKADLLTLLEKPWRTKADPTGIYQRMISSSLATEDIEGVCNAALAIAMTLANDDTIVTATATSTLDITADVHMQPLSIANGGGGVDRSPDSAYTTALTIAKKYVEAIMTNEIEDIPGSHGMRILRNIPNPETNSKPQDIVIRSVTFPFWLACVDAVDTKDARIRVCAVGTPGIGKSTSTALLIRILLSRGRSVVYLIRTEEKDNWYYEFVPHATESGGVSYSVQIYPESWKCGNIQSLNLGTTYYIVDPGKTNDSCDVSDTFLPKLIIVASPDEKHWGESEFLKFREPVDGMFLFYPVWTLDELLCARAVLAPKLSEEKVMALYREFGGVPRTVFYGNDAKFDLIRPIRRALIATLKPQEVESIASGYVDLVATFESKQPKSAIIGYTLCADTTVPESTTMQEDSLAVFRKYEVIVLSPLIAEEVYSKHMKVLWGSIFQYGASGWHIFEAYTRQLMMGESIFLQCRVCCSRTDVQYNEDNLVWKIFGSCQEIRLTSDSLESALLEPNIVFHSIHKTYPLVDFVYKDKNNHIHAFQVTVGKTHNAELVKIRALAKKVISSDDRNKNQHLSTGLVGTDSASNSSLGNQPFQVRRHPGRNQPLGSTKLSFSLYYLVPEYQFNKFVTNPVNPVKDLDPPICDIWHVRIPNPNGE